MTLPARDQSQYIHGLVNMSSEKDTTTRHNIRPEKSFEVLRPGPDSLVISIRLSSLGCGTQTSWHSHCDI